MQISVKRMLRTRGAVVAGITALAVGLALVVGEALQKLIGFLPATSGLYDLETLGYDPFASFGLEILLAILPFVTGYFLSLWVIAPITEQLRIGHVITRSILATGIGATLYFVVSAVYWGIVAFSANPDLSAAGLQTIFELQKALTALVTVLPLGVLGGVLLWLWRTANPAEHHIEGLIDV